MESPVNALNSILCDNSFICPLTILFIYPTVMVWIEWARHPRLQSRGLQIKKPKG